MATTGDQRVAVAEHTPGPWVVTHLGLDATSVFPADRNTNNGCAVAQFFGPDRRHNAQLSAAAPAMLAALKDAADFLASEYAMAADPDNRQGWSDSAAYENYKFIGSAIAAATAPQPPSSDHQS